MMMTSHWKSPPLFVGRRMHIQEMNLREIGRVVMFLSRPINSLAGRSLVQDPRAKLMPGGDSRIRAIPLISCRMPNNRSRVAISTSLLFTLKGKGQMTELLRNCLTSAAVPLYRPNRRTWHRDHSCIGQLLLLRPRPLFTHSTLLSIRNSSSSSNHSTLLAWGFPFNRRSFNLCSRRQLRDTHRVQHCPRRAQRNSTLRAVLVLHSNSRSKARECKRRPRFSFHGPTHLRFQPQHHLRIGQALRQQRMIAIGQRLKVVTHRSMRVRRFLMAQVSFIRVLCRHNTRLTQERP